MNVISTGSPFSNANWYTIAAGATFTAGADPNYPPDDSTNQAKCGLFTYTIPYKIGTTTIGTQDFSVRWVAPSCTAKVVTTDFTLKPATPIAATKG